MGEGPWATPHLLCPSLDRPSPLQRLSIKASHRPPYSLPLEVLGMRRGGNMPGKPVLMCFLF